MSTAGEREANSRHLYQQRKAIFWNSGGGGLDSSAAFVQYNFIPLELAVVRRRTYAAGNLIGARGPLCARC